MDIIKTLVCGSLVLCGLAFHAGASAACYVSKAATGANSGTSWANAYTNLQSALHNAACTEVWVAKGVYKPTASTTDRTATFSIPPGLEVYGGFAGTETSAAQADPAANRTVLSGDIDGNDTTDADGVVRDAGQVAGNNSYTVVTMDGSTAAGPIGNDTVLDGVAITAGSGDPMRLSGGTTGGGLYCVGDGIGRVCSPLLTRLWFVGNAAAGGAGALFRGENSGVSAPILRAVTFSGNRASITGSAIMNHAWSGTVAPTLSNATLAGNATNEATIYSETSIGSVVQILDGVTFAANTGGVAIHANSSNGGTITSALDNSIVWDAITTAEFTGLSNLTVRNSIVRSGCVNVTTCSGVTTTDPLLGALQYNGGATMTALPGAGSPAIDAGDAATCGTAPYDVDQRGISRPRGLACDLGAVEVRQTKLTVAVSGPGAVSADASAPGVAANGIAGCRSDSGTCSAGYMAEAQAASALLNIAADAHAHAVSLSDNCGVGGTPVGTLAGSNYVLAAFADDCTVMVTFAVDMHAVGGSINGLAGNGLALQINGGETVTSAAGTTSYQFPTTLPWNTHYEIAIAAQPTQPWQTCAVANGSGDVGDADVTDVDVSCTTNTYTVRGDVDGLAAGSTVDVRLDGGETLVLGNGPYAFATTVASGLNYSVDIALSPIGHNCTLDNASGTIGGADAVVNVHCVASATALTLASDRNPSFAGQAVTLTATLASLPGSPAPTGSIDFFDGANPIAGCASVPLGAGVAVCTTSALATGSHALRAEYAGDSNNLPSSGTLQQQVDAVVVASPKPVPTLSGWMIAMLAVVLALAGVARARPSRDRPTRH